MKFPERPPYAEVVNPKHAKSWAKADEPVAAFIWCTPALAEALVPLAAGVNRPVRRSRVVEITSDVDQGRWELTAQGVGFDTAGRLFDGQHRMTSIARGKVSLPILTVRGLAFTAAGVTDQGRRRTRADVVAMSGLAVDKHAAAVIGETTRHLVMWAHGRDMAARRGFRVPNWLIQELLPIHNDLLLAAGVSLSVPAWRAIRIAPPGFWGCLHMATTSGAHADKAAPFWDGLTKGIGQVAGEAAYALRQLLTRHLHDKKDVHLGNSMAIAGINAWNHHVDGRHIDRYGVPRGSRYPRILGSPDWATGSSKLDVSRVLQGRKSKRRGRK